MTTSIAAFSDDVQGWERALYAFLAEKERRSGSRRTVESYSRMLSHFFGRLGKTPDEVTPTEVFAYARGKGLSGREPSSVTIGARIACLSAFYKFLIRMELATSNPCDKLQRPRVTPSPPRGLSGEQIRKLLNVIPDTPVGLRDGAIILTLVFTGRRRSEVLNLKAGNLEVGDRVFYSYRGKGGKRGRRELPQPAYEAIRRALAAFCKDLSTMRPDESLWPSRSSDSAGITSGTFYGNLRKYLKAT
ncbi:MAG: tyrosine-type recombinase/integrase, partial [Chloroflexi bacterium]|nr:tyrosine-type recombinase/integrase [Chloroflexota bacterium]